MSLNFFIIKKTEVIIKFLILIKKKKKKIFAGTLQYRWIKGNSHVP